MNLLLLCSSIGVADCLPDMAVPDKQHPKLNPTVQMEDNKRGDKVEIELTHILDIHFSIL